MKNIVLKYLYNVLLMVSIATELFNLFNSNIVIKIISFPNIYPNIVLTIYNLLYLIFVFILLFSEYKKVGIGLIVLSLLGDIFVKNYTEGILRIDSILCLSLLSTIVWDKAHKYYRSVVAN